MYVSICIYITRLSIRAYKTHLLDLEEHMYEYYGIGTYIIMYTIVLELAVISNHLLMSNN